MGPKSKSPTQNSLRAFPSAAHYLGMGNGPLGYLITLTGYGTRLHGDPRGSVDRAQNHYEEPFLEPHKARQAFAAELMNAPESRFDSHQRDAILRACQEVCLNRHWELLAIHVRTNHVHLVIEATCPVSQILRDLKCNASRRLNQLEGRVRPRWSKHGSTRYLWNGNSLRAAVDYVAERQGKPLARYVTDQPIAPERIPD